MKRRSATRTVTIRMDAELLDRIDGLAGTQTFRPTRTATIEALCRRGLEPIEGVKVRDRRQALAQATELERIAGQLRDAAGAT